MTADASRPTPSVSVSTGVHTGVHTGIHTGIGDPRTVLDRITVLRGLDLAGFHVSSDLDPASESDRGFMRVEGCGEALLVRLPKAFGVGSGHDPEPDDPLDDELDDESGSASGDSSGDDAAAPDSLDDVISAGFQAEARALVLAGRLGLAPPTLQYDATDGFWVLSALAGQRLDEDTIQIGDRLARAAMTLRRLHISGWSIPRHHDPFDCLRLSAHLMREGGAGLSVEGLRVLDDAVKTCRDPLTATAPTAALCALAPWPGCALDTGTRVLVLDWRRAAMSDPHHDLAGLCESLALDGEQEAQVLRAYFGTDRCVGADRVRVFRFLVAYQSLMAALAPPIPSRDSDDTTDPRAIADQAARCRDIAVCPTWTQALDRVTEEAF